MKSLKLRITSALFATAIVASGCTFDGIYDLPIPGGSVNEDNSFEISADFADALNLVPRSSVMVGDVAVGEIQSVTRVGWRARVTMRVKNEVDLPDNAEAEIRQRSLLGEKFIALSPPTKRPGSGKTPASVGRLDEGDVIPLDRTGANPEVEEVLGALSLVLTGGGVGQIQTITRELNQMMDGRTGEIKHVLGELNSFVGTLNDQRGDIVQALESINGLSQTLVSEKETIGDALGAVGPAVDVLRDQHTQLVGMLVELDKLGEVGTRVVNETKDDLIAELRHLEPLLRELSNTDDALVTGLVGAASYPFPIDAANAIRGDFANVVFKMQINLNPVGEGGLLPTTLDEVVQLCRGTPAAPICSPIGGAFDQLCAVLGSLPLCTESDVAEVEAALVRANIDGRPSSSAEPDQAPATGDLTDLLPTTPGGGGSGDGLLIELIGGLLGGSS